MGLRLHVKTGPAPQAKINVIEKMDARFISLINARMGNV